MNWALFHIAHDHVKAVDAGRMCPVVLVGATPSHLTLTSDTWTSKVTKSMPFVAGVAVNDALVETAIATVETVIVVSVTAPDEFTPG